MTNKVQMLTSMIAARNLLAAGWTQGTLARDANGTGVQFQDTAATCFCAMGAIARTRTVGDSTGGVFRLVEKETDIGNLVKFNDTEGRTQAEVVAVFDKAIEALKLEIVIDNLTTAKAKLQEPGVWTKGYFWTDETGNQYCHIRHATCFCTLGAIKMTGVDDVMTSKEHDLLKSCLPLHATEKMVAAGKNIAVARFNDAEERTLPEVLALFDAAIALAKAGAK